MHTHCAPLEGEITVDLNCSFGDLKPPELGGKKKAKALMFISLMTKDAEDFSYNASQPLKIFLLRIFFLALHPILNLVVWFVGI